MEGNASVHQVNPVSRITGEGRGGLGGGGVGQLNLCVETIHSFKGINVTVLEIMHHFIMYIL